MKKHIARRTSHVYCQSYSIRIWCGSKKKKTFCYTGTRLKLNELFIYCNICLFVLLNSSTFLLAPFFWFVLVRCVLLFISHSAVVPMAACVMFRLWIFIHLFPHNLFQYIRESAKASPYFLSRTTAQFSLYTYMHRTREKVTSSSQYFFFFDCHSLMWL